MTPKERQLATIRRELTDRISADAIFIYNFPDIAVQLGVGIGEVWSELGIDGRLMLLEYKNEFTQPPTDPNRVTWSTTLLDENSSQYGTQRIYPLAQVKRKEDIDAYDWPDPDDFNYDLAAENAKLWGDTYAIRGPEWVPVFCKACDLFGMEAAMIRMMTEPDIFEAALDRITDVHVQACERLLDTCGDAMPIFCVGDDFATQRGLMISPSKWRQFIKPRIDRIIDVGRKRNKVIWFHSCGDVTSVLPDLIEMGVQVWETVQLQTLPYSPVDLKKKFGDRLTFFGGINTQKLPFANAEDIRAEVNGCIEVLGEGGGYICGPDHTINLDVPPQNTIDLFQAVTSFRKEGYTL
ncbi:MAG: uroporphyrinogen decarboxylase family protein [Desulfobacterales bacterium]